METKKYQLPKEFAIKWIEALRSGKFYQTKEMLFDKGTCKYCCLGVAGHIQGVPNDYMNRVGELAELNDGRNEEYIEEKFKIPTELVDGYLKSELIHLNDQMGKSFNDIADWVEQNVEFI